MHTVPRSNADPYTVVVSSEEARAIPVVAYPALVERVQDTLCMLGHALALQDIDDEHERFFPKPTSSAANVVARAKTAGSAFGAVGGFFCFRSGQFEQPSRPAKGAHACSHSYMTRTPSVLLHGSEEKRTSQVLFSSIFSSTQPTAQRTAAHRR